MPQREKAGRGRPAVHLDNADGPAAHRERAARRMAVGDAAVALTSRPTPVFVELMIDRLIEQAADPAEVKAAMKDCVDNLRIC